VLKEEVAVKLILEMIMGRSSSLYNELYNEGLINNTLILITPLKRIMHIRLSVANPKILDGKRKSRG